MKKLIMLAVAFAAATSLIAETETVGGYTWMCSIDGGTTGNMV